MIVFIRHAQTRIDPAVPPTKWPLTQSAYQARKHLALGFKLKKIVSSEEFKARETAGLMAEALSVPWRSAANLHEPQRRHMPFMERDLWLQTIRPFSPDRMNSFLGKKLYRPL